MKPIQEHLSPLFKPTAGELDALLQIVVERNEDVKGAYINMIGVSLLNLPKTSRELNVDPGGIEHLWKRRNEIYQRRRCVKRHGGFGEEADRKSLTLKV